MDDRLKKLEERIALAHLGGGEKRIEKQHAKKKLTARERIHFFLDEQVEGAAPKPFYSVLCHLLTEQYLQKLKAP